MKSQRHDVMSFGTWRADYTRAIVQAEMEKLVRQAQRIHARTIESALWPLIMSGVPTSRLALCYGPAGVFLGVKIDGELVLKTDDSGAGSHVRPCDPSHEVACSAPVLITNS